MQRKFYALGKILCTLLQFVAKYSKCDNISVESFQIEYKKKRGIDYMAKRTWLVDIRKAAGFKQYEVADKVDISRGYYSAIENGIRKTPGDVALKISMILNFPMDKFYRSEIQDWVDGYSEETEQILEKQP